MDARYVRIEQMALRRPAASQKKGVRSKMENPSLIGAGQHNQLFCHDFPLEREAEDFRHRREWLVAGQSCQSIVQANPRADKLGPLACRCAAVYAYFLS